MVVESRPRVGEERRWRIDYQVASPQVAAAARRVAIYKRNRFSDHAPLTIDYDWEL